MSASPGRESRRSAGPDPFRALALLSIVLGMLIVAGGVVFWALTGRESSLIIGTGVALTIGGPISDRFGEGVKRLGELAYYAQREPEDRAEPPPSPPPIEKDR
jgi:hypothetical protein